MRDFMIVLAVIFGALAGAVANGFPGALLGASIGFGLWGILSLRSRLTLLEQEVSELRRKLDLDGAKTSPEPSGPPEAAGTVDSPHPAQLAQTPDAVSAGGPDATPLPEWRTEWIEEADETWPSDDGRREVPSAPMWSLPEFLQRFIAGGSLLVKTGVVILFIGVSFLVKYAAEHDLFPIELRLTGAALGGIALLGVGWRLRNRRPLYAHALQGGGVGLLYLTIFAAFRLYDLIPPVLAFALLVAVAGTSSVLAVLQEARSLAVLGASGGFLAPVLASTGTGSHIVLFGYYALLNLGIAAIAWFRAWRILNLIGFAFTFVIGASWGWRYYQPEYFSTTEPFLILFFLIYTFIAVLFALRQPPDLKGYLDGTLVFATPVVAFALQAILVEPYRFGLAWSAVLLGLFYLPLAMILFRKRPQYMRTLTEAFFAFGVIFGTLAIPLALENRWTAAAWALEGAAILWAGVRQRRRLARVFGILLQLGAGVAFLADIHASTGTIPVLNGFFMGCALIALTGIFSARLLHCHRESLSRPEAVIGHILLAWGLLWWFSGGLREIDRHVSPDYAIGAVLVFLALSCLCCDLAAKRLFWPAMAWPALALLPMLYLCGLAMFGERLHPFAEWGFAGWPIAFAAVYLLLYRHDDLRPPLPGMLHGAALWLLTAVAILELGWRLDRWIAGSTVWPHIVPGLAPSLIVLAVSTRGERLPLPTSRHYKEYLSWGCVPLASFAWLWVWHANLTSPGDPAPLPYLPLLNPLDLTVGLALVSLVALERKLRNAYPALVEPSARRLFPSFLMATVFVWLTAVLVRTVHHWGGVPFTPFALYRSLLLQAAVSIFWSLLALFAMVYATSGKNRQVWFSGAGLLAAVVLKLFIIDLSGIGTVARIVSFVGVGILLLVIGYFAPVPPRVHGEDRP